MTRSARYAGCFVAGAAVVALLHALRVFQTTVSDDAYILYRYAAHLADGHGLVWNVGQPPIEGFTSLLDVLLLAAARGLGFDLVVSGQVIGLVFASLGTAAAAWLGHEVSGGDTRVAILAAWLFALSPSQAAWARGGMETSLFTCLAAVAIAAWMKERRSGSRRWMTCATFLVAGLARPEAIPLGFLAIAFDLRGECPLFSWWPFVAGVAALACFKLAYFGDVLPNTYYAKTGGGLWALEEGVTYVLRFFRAYGMVNIALALVPLTLAPKALGWRSGYLLAATALMCAEVARIGGDYQYFGRYLVPILPWLSVLTAIGCVRLYEAFPTASRSRRIALAAATLTLGMVQLALPSLRELRDRPWLLTRPWRLTGDTDPNLFRPDFELMGRALAHIAEPSDTVAALAVGAIGYFSDRPILDCLGLNDREIARVPVVRAGRASWRSGHMKGSAAAILSRPPDIVVLPMRPTSQPCQLPGASELATYPFVGELLATDEFRNGYAQRSAMLPDGRFMGFFVRDRGRPVAPGTQACASP